MDGRWLILMSFSLYIHIPYCHSKCPYCDFNSHAAASWPEADYVRALCAELGGTPVEKSGPADILVNCTPAGLAQPARSFEQLPIAQDELTGYGCVVDFVYREGGTPLVRAARERSVAAVDGLQLLLGQGALAFELFTQRPAPTTVMREALRG